MLVCVFPKTVKIQTHLVKGVQKIGNQRRTLRRSGQCVSKTKLLQVSNETAGAVLRKGQAVAPKVPLKGDDGHAGHARPDHAEC